MAEERLRGVREACEDARIVRPLVLTAALDRDAQAVQAWAVGASTCSPGTMRVVLSHDD